MSSRVGVKGNIVIDKQIRDRLGVQPGWETVQLLRDGYVEVHFLAPHEPGDSFGCVKLDGDVSWMADEAKLKAAIDDSMAEAVRERYAGQLST